MFRVTGYIASAYRNLFTWSHGSLKKPFLSNIEFILAGLCVKAEGCKIPSDIKTFHLVLKMSLFMKLCDLS